MDRPRRVSVLSDSDAKVPGISPVVTVPSPKNRSQFEDLLDSERYGVPRAASDRAVEMPVHGRLRHVDAARRCQDPRTSRLACRVISSESCDR
jgi:hypothetical protein